MKIVVDMNLSPEWVEVLERQGVKASHWRDISDPEAPDAEILRWARKRDHLVFTNDLDFGRLLALMLNSLSLLPSLSVVTTLRTGH